MTDATEKPIAQVAYEAFLEGIAGTEEGAAEAEHAPPWEAVPAHVRAVIANAVAAAVRTFAPALVVETTEEEQSFAQIGYQAYIASTGGLNYQGLPCPEWAKLTDSIRGAWAAAATAVRTEHEHRTAGDYELSFSAEELFELVAGLDAMQRANVHQPDVAFPLRARLRAALLPDPDPAVEPEPEPVPDTVDRLSPLVRGTAAESGPSDLGPPKLPVAVDVLTPDLPPNPAELSEHGKAWHDTHRQLNGLPPLETPSAATESPSAEAERTAPATEPSPPGDANAGLVGGPELPSPSKAPPGPGIPPLDLGIPGPPALPTDTDPPAGAEPEKLADVDITEEPPPPAQG